MANGMLHYKNITLEKVLTPNQKPRLTKIICTIGPSCNTVEKLVDLIDAGMNVCRLNFSHGDHATHLATITNINAARALRPESCLAILLDTKGPEIRTGFLQEQFKEAGLPLTQGQVLTIWSDDYSRLADATGFSCSYSGLPTTVKVGDSILAADGSLVFKVIELLTNGVTVVCQNDGVLGERKNMNLPGNKVTIPTITDKDESDLKTFAGLIDFVAVSFVQNGHDFESVKAALGDEGKFVKIIAKIENQEGLQNFPSIVETFDGVMVARGDLGMEIPISKVFLAQKYLIRNCNLLGKPVITATQMLESMTKNPRPTRAESTDVANAVLDGTDCVMLSGETAGGKFPIESCQTLSEICKESEGIINHDKLFSAIVGSSKTEVVKSVHGNGLSEDKDVETIASSVVKARIDALASLIFVISENGVAARKVAKYRPGCPILVLTNNERLARQLSGIVSSVFIHIVSRTLKVEEVLEKGFEFAKKQKWVKPDEQVVVLKRVKRKEGFKHLMEIINIPN